MSVHRLEREPATKIDNRRRKKMSKTELMLKAQFAASLGGHAMIAGEWVWVTFDRKPSEEVRTELKEEGFCWSRTRSKWYFAGKPSAGGAPNWGHIVRKYGLEEIEGATA